MVQPCSGDYISSMKRLQLIYLLPEVLCIADNGHISIFVCVGVGVGVGVCVCFSLQKELFLITMEMCQSILLQLLHLCNLYIMYTWGYLVILFLLISTLTHSCFYLNPLHLSHGCSL